MATAAVAGPSRLPQTVTVEVPSSSNARQQQPLSSVASMVANEGAMANGHAHAGPGLANGPSNGPVFDISTDDDIDSDDAGSDVQPVQARGTVYKTTDDIVHRVFRPPTGYCYSTKMTYHAYVGENEEDVHPEEPDRITGIHKRLQGAGLISRMQRIAVREAVKAEATLVHSAELWHKVNSFAQQPHQFYVLNRLFFSRLSLYVNEHTALCARLSLGGVIETCRAVAEGKIANAFAIVRPPGHHAEPEQAMGFCFYNNVAVAAAYLKNVYREQGIKKILILDWDVHHGNGTQKAFWSDPDILYVSIHRYDNGEFYPGGSYGGADMTGGEGAEGRCVNIPWPCGGMTDADYVAAFQRIVMPIAYEFKPDFVLVSAGFDAAEGDQLGGCHVSPAGYAQMTHMLSALAGGRMVIALEGGYNVDSIAKSALECVKVLLGEMTPEMPALVAQPAAVRALHLVAEEQSRHWKCITPTYARRNELANAGRVTPISEILKAHRTHYLYNEFGMYNVPLSDAILEETFKDQLLVTPNVFTCDTLVLLVHDMGNLRAELNSLTADVKHEKSFLLDTSHQIVEWATKRDWALIDINILAHSESIAGLDPRQKDQRERQFVLHVWDTIIQMASNIKRVVLIGQSVGCNALINLLNQRSGACRPRVKAAVQLFDMYPPLALAGNTEAPGLRSWFHGLSMAIFPTEQVHRAEKVRDGNRYTEVLISRDPRPTHVLHDRWGNIATFIEQRVTLPPPASGVASASVMRAIDPSNGHARSSIAGSTLVSVHGLNDVVMDVS